MNPCTHVTYAHRMAAAFLTVSLAVLIPAIGLTQVGPGEIEREEIQLPIGLTAEEMTRLHEIGMYQRATPPPAPPVRECAEWEPVTGVLVRYSYGFGVSYDILREYAEDVKLHVLCVSSQQTSCWNNLESNGVNMANVELLDIVTNSMWTRDYGPQVQYSDGTWGISDFVYNRPRPDDDDVPWQLGTEWGCSVYGSDLVFTGGNFLTNGHGTAFSTELIWDENPGMTHAAIAQELEDFLGIKEYVVLPDISTSGIHHIDCWMKLLNEETILVHEVDPAHEFYDDLEARVADLSALTNCYGRPYTIVRVYCGSIGGGDVAAYSNSLIVRDKVFVPTYGISSDAAALATYEAAMPGYEVLGFEGSWLSDDAIHCRGMEIHDRYMLMVDTNPLQDRTTNDSDYRVTAYIDDRSETGLVADSLIVYWRLEGSPGFNAAVMQSTAHPDSYYADIPQQADSVNVEYYVFAKDNGGRRETRPVVAPNAWYPFNTGGHESTCSVHPTSLDFGTVLIGSYGDTTFTITNTGADTLSGDVSETCDHYSIISGGGAYSLATGQSRIVTVRFEPTVSGTHNCSIETGQMLCSDVACTGAGEDPPACSVDPVALDFGIVNVGAWKDTAFTITNTGGGTLSGSVSESCAEYSIVSGGGAYALTAGQSVTVTVRFEPTAAGTHNCSMETGQALCADVACTGVGEEPPVCEVEPAALDFGVVNVGTWKDTTFNITNTGGGILSGDVSETCDYYSIVSGWGAYDLTAGQSVTVTVRFDPPPPGVESTYDFQTGGGIDKWFYESGDCGSQPPGTPPDAVEVTTYTEISQSDDDRYGTVYARRNYPLHDFAFAIAEAEESVTQIYVEWEGYATDISGTLWLYIWDSDANAWIQVDSTTQESGDDVLSGTFTSNLERFIDGSGVLWLAANCRAATAASGGGTFFTDHVKAVVSCGPGSTHSCSIETGQALCSDVACTGVSDDSPICSVDPLALDFGIVTVGATKDTTFSITNTGGGTLSGDVSEACAEYSIVSGGGAYDLTAGQSVTVTVRFEPTVAGTHNCSIETGQALCSDVACTGVGEDPPACAVDPVALDFGIVTVGATKDTTFSITNTGGGTLSGDVSEVCAEYSIVSGGGAYDLTAGQSVTVTVRFEPTVAGTHNCSIETGQALCSDVACTGVGEDPPACSVDPPALDFGIVTVGATKDTTFSITNTGGGTLSGDVSEACAEYSIVSGGGVYDLTAGQSVTVTVRFEPTVAGTHNCSIETGQALCSDVACTGVGEDPPACSVDPLALDFGIVTVGATKDTTFSITNTGGGTLSGDVSESCAEYSIVSGGGVYDLTAGQSVTVTVRFEPSVSGTHNCSIETGQALCSDVACTGVGEDPPACSVDPLALDFGIVTVGATKDTTFSITNTGGGTLSGDVSEACAEYSLVSGGGVYDLTAGQSVTVTVRFEPTVAGTHNCSIETGQALCSDVACTGVGEDPPACSVDPLALDFGIVTVGATKDTAFSITNTGGGTLSGDVSEACAEYSIVSGGGAYDLTAGQSVTVTVRFEPSVSGTHNCSIETGQALCSDVACTGVGEDPPACSVDPLALDFGIVTVGATKDTTFSITNTGGGTLSGDVSETSAEYSIVSGGGAYDLTAGQSVTVTVRFEPTVAGTHNCSIETGQALCSDVACTGVGEDPPACAVDPLALDFGIVTVGATKDTTFSITNTGGGTLSGDVSETSAEYSIVSGGGAYDLTAGQSVTVTVRFEPTVAGTHNCSIETGQVLCSDVACTGVGEDPPACAVDPLALDFGIVTVGATKDTTFSITNTGGGTLSGDVSETSAEYSIVSGGGAYDLTAGQSVTVTVRFEPSVSGTHNCSIETGQVLCSDVACTGVGEDPPACAVDPVALDFGIVTVGATKDTTFSITNTGGGTLSGDVSEACAEYSIVSGGGAYDLTAGQSVTVTVRFEPTVSGTHNCSIETGQALCSDVACTGVGEDPPACAVDPVALDFGIVTVGATKDTTFSITNTGGGTLSGDVSEACAEYSIVSGGGAYDLTAGQSVTVTVRFEPTVSGTHNCSIETGQVLCSDVACTGVGEDPPACAVDPVALDFGIVTVGATKDTTFSITNTGGGTLSGDVSEACAEYSIVSGGGAYDLTAGQSVTVTVRFEPTVSGTHNCSIETGQALCSDVACTGVGEDPPACAVDPVALDFGIVTVGATKDTTFSITNTGGGTLSGDVSETSAEYSIVSGGGAYDLTAGQSVTVTVRFEPTVSGTHNCSIETGQALCSDVACTGVGDDPPACLVQPDSLDFGAVMLGSSEDRTFSITNTGGGVLQGSVNEPCTQYWIVSGGGFYGLAAGESLTVTVRLQPTAAGTRECRIETGQALCSDVFCTGYGCLAPVACFTADLDTVCVDSVICFFDCSSGSFTEWYWDFGDGSDTTGVADPQHVYADSGTVAVRLIVSSPLCGADTTSLDIVVWMPPLSSVIADGRRGPVALYLGDNYPNPFNPNTTIEIGIPGPGGLVNLAVYDVRGRRVRTLIDQHLEPGTYETYWDGRNDAGESLSSGIYFYRLSTPQGVEQRKAVMLK